MTEKSLSVGCFLMINAYSHALSYCSHNLYAMDVWDMPHLLVISNISFVIRRQKIFLGCSVFYLLPSLLFLLFCQVCPCFVEC